MTSSNGNMFRVTGPLCGEFTCHRWIPPHKGQWRGALVFSFICAWINGWANNRQAGDLRRHRTHYDVTVMVSHTPSKNLKFYHAAQIRFWCTQALWTVDSFLKRCENLRSTLCWQGEMRPHLVCICHHHAQFWKRYTCFDFKYHCATSHGTEYASAGQVIWIRNGRRNITRS